MLIDESTDLAVNKHLIIYVRIVDEQFVPKTYFLKNVTIDNPKSDANMLFELLKETLAEKKLDIHRVLGFGSDGAAVITGKKNGVSAKIKKESLHCINVHCMAHGFNLATSQSSKNITFLTEVERTLIDLYYHFRGSKSGNRKCELKEIQKILDDPVLQIRECHEIRWLSFFEAVKAVFLSWASFVTYFSRCEDSKSKLVHKRLSDYKFVCVASHVHGHFTVAFTDVHDPAETRFGYFLCSASLDRVEG